MFKSFARLGAAFVTVISLSLPAAASTFSIDYSDLWGGGQPNPTEQGWGLNLIQQGDIIFATMFVYGADNTARWFSASALTSSNGTTWNGSLSRTTGPYYGAPWSNSGVTNVVVGSMTITFSNANAGSLSYTADGVTVNKQISRFTLRAPNLAGRYLGGAVATCTNGNQILIFDAMNVTQSGASLTMVVDFFNNQGVASRCTYTGSLTTTGRTGSISGNYSCTFGTTAGNVGTFTVTNLESSINGFNGTLAATDQFCTMNGRFGGVKDVQ
jgi:hypothetical protein